MTPCYTANFVAPEVLKRQGYDAACDIWSLGVILYAMLAGYCPFATGPNDSPNMILSRISSGRIDLEEGVWKTISQEAKDLLRLMLHVAPSKRPTASQLVHHPWLSPGKHTTPKVQQSNNSNSTSNRYLREAVAATYRALATSPQTAHLGPVAMSELARRRFKDKALAKMQS